MKLTLLNNKTLPVTEDGLVNIRDLAKEMYPVGQDTNALSTFYKSALFTVLNESLTRELTKTSSSKILKKLPTDRMYPSLVCKEMLQAFLMNSTSDLAARWKVHLITVILPEYERLYAKEFKDVIDQQDYMLHTTQEHLEVVEGQRDIQELIRTRDVIGLLEACEWKQQVVCDLLRDTPDYQAGGYLSPTMYAEHHNISIELARFTIDATPEPHVCPNSQNDGYHTLHWKSVLATVVPAKHPTLSRLPAVRKRNHR